MCAFLLCRGSLPASESRAYTLTHCIPPGRRGRHWAALLLSSSSSRLPCCGRCRLPGPQPAPSVTCTPLRSTLVRRSRVPPPSQTPIIADRRFGVGWPLIMMILPSPTGPGPLRRWPPLARRRPGRPSLAPHPSHRLGARPPGTGLWQLQVRLGVRPASRRHGRLKPILSSSAADRALVVCVGCSGPKPRRST